MDDKTKGVTRRGLLKGIATTAVATAAGSAAALAEEARKAAPPGAGLPVSVTVNGQVRQGLFEPRTTLAEALREAWGLTGTKIGCDRGACGACTVLLDGLAVNSCLTLVHDADGKSVTTIEGLGAPDALSPVQKAFVEADAMQCGFCTPGMIVSAEALRRRTPDPTAEEIRSALAGNLCRCATYNGLIAACGGARTGGSRG
ncbi:MAG TPA: (2Fe-2S)-binding protein [Thermoanaerobaculia bacterium]|nr:(2Fe-2S)-binding protein [Thermoanaerobaculia bacterium]HQR67308.1 (2Fe-2S)-binding protein [Thermoanaerobaculia bacterium]